MTEAGSRVIIDKLLSEVGWILIESDRNRNVDFEVTNEAGRLDYLLRDSNGFPLCILEAKSELNDPLDGKEQARRYADQEGCRFIILSNGFHHYFWDLEKGSPISILTFPTQEYLELRKDNFSPPIDDDEEIKSIIRKHWHDVEGRSGKMLRLFRDHLMIACEQKRFSDLFKEVKAEGSR